MMNELALVTGGTGFLGRNLVDELVRRGMSVRVLARGHHPFPQNVEGIRAEVGDRRAVREALRDVRRVFHFASTTTPVTAHGRSSHDIESNLIASVMLMEEAAAAGIERFVFASSGGTVYGPVLSAPISEDHPTNPICSHGIVKLAVEKYLQMYAREGGFSSTILRYANPYGPGQSSLRTQGVVAVLMGRVIRGEEIQIWGDGSIVRDFLYIDDLVEATVVAAESPAAANEIMNIGSGFPASIRDLVEGIERATGSAARIRWMPARPFDVKVSLLDITRASTTLGWQPRTRLDDGLSLTASWLRSRVGAERESVP
ncbi:MAG: NAD-dependent epimerase/dehydratase family protein [Acidobacteriota bacterium]